jgi:hypothetical protein
MIKYVSDFDENGIRFFSRISTLEKLTAYDHDSKVIANLKDIIALNIAIYNKM